MSIAPSRAPLVGGSRVLHRRSAPDRGKLATATPRAGAREACVTEDGPAGKRTPNYVLRACASHPSRSADKAPRRRLSAGRGRWCARGVRMRSASSTKPGCEPRRWSPADHPARSLVLTERPDGDGLDEVADPSTRAGAAERGRGDQLGGG